MRSGMIRSRIRLKYAGFFIPLFTMGHNSGRIVLFSAEKRLVRRDLNNLSHSTKKRLQLIFGYYIILTLRSEEDAAAE